MLFQTLDDKKECVAVFKDGELIYGELPLDLSATWKYTSILRDMPVEYASLYCGHGSLEEMCPEYLSEKWKAINNKLKSFLISFRESKISLDDNCFFDLVPERFLLEYCSLKNGITEYVFENYNKPLNYNFLLELSVVLEDIKYNKLNLNLNNMDLSSLASRKQFKKINNSSKRISYDISGTKTGRLTTSKNSFPILTLNKEYRGIIEPNNNWLVELDFNAAELRTILALLGKKQPKEDIHEWNAKNVYRGKLSRDEAKKRIFSWLYNPDSQDHLSSGEYDRESLLNKFWNGTHVHTMFNREIESDKYHALNYIIQSTSSDLFLKRMIEVHRLLENRKSFISFSMHDSLVIDLSVEDKDILNNICETFSQTDLGKYKINVSAGKNYAEMKKIL